MELFVRHDLHDSFSILIPFYKSEDIELILSFKILLHKF